MSTCRFAQRVSTIKNDARVNEDVDPEVVIRRLRSDCAVLADEVAFLKVKLGRNETTSRDHITQMGSARFGFLS